MKTFKRIYLPVAAIVLVCILGLFILPSKFEHESIESEYEPEESIEGYHQWLKQTLADPATGKIPAYIFQSSLSFCAALPIAHEVSSKADYGIWVQRGPNNVGGRTRSLAIDVSNENRMVTGAVSGGIWKSEDGGGSWQKMSSDTDFTPTTCIVQDTRKGKINTWYAGTGEFYGSAIPSGDFILGNGIRKSTDQGKTWQRLLSTYSSSPTVSNSLSFVHRLAINPAIDSIDAIFAATVGGIFRSNDGGKTWIRRRGISSDWGFTDVAIDKNGVVYATLQGSFSQGGIWRSTDNGLNWVNISPTWFNSDVNRMVMCISPDDANQIYFLAYSPGIGKLNNSSEWHSLWKYTYKSGNGTGTGGVWEDRSENIPNDTTNKMYGIYTTQKGYTMHIRVRPGHPDEIYIGGVSLFKSTDGFKSTTHITRIGGEKLDNDPLLILIPNQHADEHDIIFSPSNNKKAITVSDGGIEYTNDISASTIVWESMNNGYMSTQFYTVGIHHDNTSPIVFAGAQDNGARFVNDVNYLKPWAKPSDGDGQLIFPGTAPNEYYISFQDGWLGRFLLDADFKMIKAAGLDPPKLSKIALFSSPFLVDENNRKRLYWADGQFLQRNPDITQIPMKDNMDYSVKVTGWSLMKGCVAPDSSSISCLTYAKAQHDVIYFGTNTGKLMRIRNASDTMAVAENISGSNFPKGYITCVATDERDSNTLFCVFSNFGILSVFQTTNGGSSWAPISGNLEQFPNGTGVGPSCRWLTIAHLPDTTLYFLGTSAGLYATNHLNGASTVWIRQGPRNIGLNWVTMMDFRTTDNTLAVSTYGAGIFTTKVSSTDHTALRKLVFENQVKIYPNPADDNIQVQLPEYVSGLPYEIINFNGDIVHKGHCEPGKPIDLQGINTGQYIFRLIDQQHIISKRLIVMHHD